MPRILLVRFSSLGDVILTTPLVRAIRTRYPSAHITFVTKAAYAPMVERAPGVDRVVARAEGETLVAVARRVGRAFDVRVDLHASLRSMALRRLVGGRWGVFRAATLRRRWMALRHQPTPPLAPVPERYIAAARAAGLAVLPDHRPAEIRPTVEDRSTALAIARGHYVVICPGAAHASKQWPAEHWRALATRLAAHATVVATGLLAERRALGAAPVVDAFGLPLGPTAALLEGAQCVIAHDSGLMHLATAVAAPVVALFGPTVPAFGYAPYRAAAQVVERSLGCRPCSTHGSARCPRGHHACLKGLLPDQVHAAIKALVA